MDFFRIDVVETKTKVEIKPSFTVGRSKDLMVRGKAFYAIWDEEAGLWSTDEYHVVDLVDRELYSFAEEYERDTGIRPVVKTSKDWSSNVWRQFKVFLNNVSDSNHQLDERITFANEEVKKSDYVSRRLPYRLEAGSIDAWDELIGTLYDESEREKIEWAIGAVVSGDAKKIQKFLVLYGPTGTGKSTILNVIQKLFNGYTTSFEAKALGQGNGFATESFRNNPLVAIQHDGDLSRIEDNTKLNSIIAHEEMSMNEKYKPTYTSRVNAFLFMGTNQPVKISDAKSGIIRRLIDVHPSGRKIPTNHYHTLMSLIDFELGAIAWHCLQVYRNLGKNHYNGYRPLEMMLQTDVFFNYIEAFYDVFKAQDGVTLKQAYSMYKEYCGETGIDRLLPQYKFREELRNYFEEFRERVMIDGVSYRSYYSGFKAANFKTTTKDEATFSLVLDETESLFDEEMALQPAQYANAKETPSRQWKNVKSTLDDLDTSRLHFVKVPEHHIVIDFDLKDDAGEKSLERNLESASSWPPTYAELSKSGAGVHLHYTYDGDVSQLRSDFAEGIEVKVYRGEASLRRLLTKCNAVPIATLSTGLPLKEQKVLHPHTIQSEKGLRDLIARNLRKEIHPGTKPSIDFIKKILDDANESGMTYDVTDLRSNIMAFANNSSNHALECLKVVQQMKFQSDTDVKTLEPEDNRLVFFDVEVYPNLFIICWKYEGDDLVVKMRNPSAHDVEALFKLNLIGYNNRRYDNHILYARYMGYTNQQLFLLSQRIINKAGIAMFGEAYNISYGDIYDIVVDKKSLKMWQVELGLEHRELDIPWDEDVPDELIAEIEDYCANDVVSTEKVWEHRYADWVARQILAEISGLSINDPTAKHTARIIFGQDRDPQMDFVYTDLSKEFPGYEFDHGQSTYRDEVTGEGGYVYAEPGIYEDVALLDIASMHPTSIIELNLFGEYTPRFAELLQARLAIKHRDLESAGKMLGGRIASYLEVEGLIDELSYALKIALNTVYGLTSARFDNPFKDPRNKDNIVAKRGALFMIDLKHAVQEQGYTVAHIKTDSIKIPNATPEIINFVQRFGEKYGYTFEHEATYSKLCLANEAVYIARKSECVEACWVAVGAQFQHPYVLKSLFTGQMIESSDLRETKQVFQGAMYLDFDAVRKPMYKEQTKRFIGRVGQFIPVVDEAIGGVLLRIKDDKQYAVAGTKGYLWAEAHVVENPATFHEDQIDWSYYDNLLDDAKKTINKFGDFEEFRK